MVNVEVLSQHSNRAVHFRGFASGWQAIAVSNGQVTLQICTTVTICNQVSLHVVSASRIAVQCAAFIATSQKIQ